MLGSGVQIPDWHDFHTWSALMSTQIVLAGHEPFTCLYGTTSFARVKSTLKIFRKTGDSAARQARAQGPKTSGSGGVRSNSRMFLVPDSLRLFEHFFCAPRVICLGGGSRFGTSIFSRGGTRGVAAPVPLLASTHSDVARRNNRQLRVVLMWI